VFALSVHWQIDSRARLVIFTVEGRATLAEVEEYLEAVTGAGATAYAKIYDGTASEGGLDATEMLTLAARFRELHHQPLGPLAIVMPSAASRERLIPVLGALAAGKRPVQFFKTVASARRWIKTLPGWS
jgi:hypothetical protein